MLLCYTLLSVQSLSHVQLFATPWTAACQASLSITNAQSLLKLMSIESVMPSNHLILCCPLLLLPSVFPSIRVFSNESVLRIRWPKYWSFSFSISPSNEYSRLISFRIDWLDLFAVQGALKSLFQHHSLKASVLWFSAFFLVQVSHTYMTNGKTIALMDLCWLVSMDAYNSFPNWKNYWDFLIYEIPQNLQKMKFNYFYHLPINFCIHICLYIYIRVREGNGTPFQYFCLENPMDGGAW